MKVILKAGQRYSICSCGYSKIMPFCDNAHRSFNLEKGTDYKSIKITPERDTTLEVTSSRWDFVDREEK